ncbi:MAG: DUF4174 domain-containing protein [Pseudorhodobacter sp.]
MTLIYRLLLLCLLPFAAMAEAMERELFLEASGLEPEEFHWVKRPVVVFADSPVDPAFLRQLDLLRANPEALAERDVVVITDTDPKALSAFRKRFRPRGFSLVMMDKDGVTTLRKPLPWDVREITRAIDKFPIARQEQLERFPSGR